MQEEQIKKLVRDEIASSQQTNQFSVTPISFHTHNGTDSQRVKQNDIINGTTSLLSLVTIASETLTVNTLQNITQITLTGIAADNFFTLTTRLAVGATSATLSTNWTQGTNVFTARFSDGSTKNVTLILGATTMTWSGGLTAPQDAFFFEVSASNTTTCPQKAVLNGHAQLGNCYKYNFKGNITNIPTKGGSYQPFLQMSSEIFTDNSDIKKTRVSASAVNLVDVYDSTTAMVAGIQIIKWTGTSIVFDTYVAPQWQISWFLSMS